MKVWHNPRYWRPTIHLILEKHKLMETEDPYKPAILSLGEGTNPVTSLLGIVLFFGDSVLYIHFSDDDCW
jgi:hypothetical protein